MPVYPYQSQEVRDLAWACFSPPLLLSNALQSDIGNAVFTRTAQRRAWLERLDRDAGPLLAHLAGQRNKRLGLYFESLWHFFLSNDPEVELIANNLPVYAHDRTLGEFDCIYYCRRRQQHVHLELAVKFYLGAPAKRPGSEISEWRDWLGPSTRDRLDLKLSHLLQHQIRLSDLPPASAELRRLGIEHPQREIEIKGYLFQPADAALPPPPGFNPGKKFCNWLPIDRLRPSLEQARSDGFQILPRSRWLSPARADDFQAISNASGLVDALSAHFQESERPLLVAALDSNGDETGRFFVTGAHWPNLS